MKSTKTSIEFILVENLKIIIKVINNLLNIINNSFLKTIASYLFK